MKTKNYKCSKCDSAVHAEALPDTVIKTGLCYQCWNERFDTVKCQLCKQAGQSRDFPKNDFALQVDHMYVKHNAHNDDNAKHLAHQYMM